MFGLLCTAWLVATSPPPRVDLLVLSTEGTELAADANHALSTALTQALDGRLGHQAVSIVDLRAMVEVEASRQVADCADDFSCLAEIGDALGARTLVSHRVTRLGGQLVWQASLLDVTTGTALARSDVTGVDVKELIDHAPALSSALLPPTALHTAFLVGGLGTAGVGALAAIVTGAWTAHIDQTLKDPPSVGAQADAFAFAAVVPWVFVGSAVVAVTGGVVALGALVVE